MKNIAKDPTLRALVASAFSIVLCLAMLLGVTFAWFTTSTTTATNTIVSAAFSVELQYCGTFDGTYADLDDSSVLFNNVTLYPGQQSDVVYIKFTNNNTYAIKPALSIGTVTTTEGKNNEMMLAFDTVTAAKTFEATDFTNSLATTTTILGGDAAAIAAGHSAIVALAFLLPEDATEPSVQNSFAITVGATQANS